jgi:hypothetical protein
MSDKIELHVGQCQVCGTQDYVTKVSYTKHTGIVVIMTTQKFKGLMCQKCVAKLFKSCEIHCALAGWWGIASLFIMNPIALIGNAIMYFRANKQFSDHHKASASSFTIN